MELRNYGITEPMCSGLTTETWNFGTWNSFEPRMTRIYADATGRDSYRLAALPRGIDADGETETNLDNYPNAAAPRTEMILIPLLDGSGWNYGLTDTWNYGT